MEEDEWDDALLSEITALETRHLQTQSHQNQVLAWSCKSCTLQNDASRGTCLVCGTPRGHSYQSPAPVPAKKTVQATLSFDGSTSVVSSQKDAPLSSTVRDREHTGRSSQTTITSGSGLVLTSRRSGSTTDPASPSQIPRHAAGEDAQAKTRYLDIVARSNFPPIDYEAAQHFVYPTNYAIRDYQLTIAEKALYHNTLVVLPTGLGKTLVAAVVMYNFYRWFPTGKIVFMAPTKPLVAQQIKACHEIMGIPLSDTAELQGNVPPTMRRVLWNSRRVFYCTPQSLQNDLRRGVCTAEKFVCIVVDEAHRATGNYAYCGVVQEIEAKTPLFRVLALSATPGAKFDVIQDVVTNLRISHIECRSADDPDVKKYTHARQEEVIVCRLGEQIVEVKKQFLKCFTPIVQRLLRGNIIQYGDPEKLTSWYVLQAREKFRKSPNYSSNRSAESDLALLISLLHAKSLLTGHGLNSFRDQIMNWGEERKKGKMSWSKREMLQSSEFQSLELSMAVTDTNSSTKTGSHPKLVKLREVLLEHFQRHAAGESSTRAIVFTQYRASVSEIVALLRPLAPLLNVQPFVGQGKAKESKGQSQKEQQEIVRRFRLGEFNVLVATCIAEEGLDIGEVDLIVSFDALTSPVRMIQRMGRTGRKRVGKVIILVTEGDEQKKLARSASAAKSVSRALTTFKSKFTYSKCPRILPTGIYPHLKELEMKIPTFHASQVGGKTTSVVLDPDLWQLSDAERAVALMKYFPPNFSSSSRNKLFPIVANRMHLLRRQPRSYVRKGIGTRVGYSARSLMLQALVRKVHGVEEVLETDSEDEDYKCDGDRNWTGHADSSNLEQPSSTAETKFDRKRRQIRVSTDNAKTDIDVGSSWRKSSTLTESGGDSRCDESFGSMIESVNTFDMHFSPQFIDSATQVASDVEEEVLSKDSRKCRHKSEAIATVKKQKTVSIILGSPRSAPNSMKQVESGKVEAHVTEGLLSAPGDRRINPENIDCDEKSQQISATLSLTLTSDSPRPPFSACKDVCQRRIEANNTTESTQQLPGAPRHRSTRQLQFDEDEVDGHPVSQTQSADPPQPDLVVPAPAPEADLQLEHDLSEVEEDKPPVFSVTLLPPDIGAETGGEETKNELEDEDHGEEPSAYSFALLPPLDTKPIDVPSKSSSSPKLTTAAPHNEGSQSVEDGTDGDEVDESNETKPAVTNEHDTSGNVLDLTKKKNYHVAEEKVEPEASTIPLTPDATSGNGVTQRSAQTQRKDAKLEQEEDGCCSVCLESESYGDDPIVFCDGCDVAVHQFCYGIRVVPNDKWFCDVCMEAQASNNSVATLTYPRCQLCPHRGGAYKRTECGQWVHVQCFLWIPEFRVEQGDDDMLVLGALNRLDADRKTLDCSLCHSQKGFGIIQCAHKRCLAAFHVSCAAFASYRLDQLDPPDGENNGCGTLFLAYCPIHRNSKAPVNIPEQQKTPPTTKNRSTSLLPIGGIKISSPSHLLASPSSAEAKKKFKTFRRLKRKYDASQSQMFSQPRTKGSPSSSSPWQKRIRRSKRRRETSRVLAAAYVDDTADVRGGATGDDDDEDDYGDDYRDAADDSFINDSSQLLYSQSVVSPEDIGSSTSKKKRKKSSPNMRAIYARSLFESQCSPLLLRRGGRHLGALPSNGIIRACLNELHNGQNELDTPSPISRSHSRVPETTEDTTAVPSAPISGSVTESDGDDIVMEAEPSPSFTLLGENVQGTIEEKDNDINVDSDMATPRFNLLGAGRSLSSTVNSASMASIMPEQLETLATSPGASTEQPVKRVQSTSDELQKKIEVNRLKALKKLEERRQAKFQQAQGQLPQPYDRAPSNKDQTSHGVSEYGFTSTAVVISEDTRKEVTSPSFKILQTTTTGSIGSVSRARETEHGMASTVDLTSPKLTIPGSVQQNQSPKWVIFVSSVFASSSGFPAFLSAKHARCTVVIDDTLEADVLLSVRTAVLVLTGQQLREMALASPGQNVVKSRRIGALLTMHKKIVVAIIHDSDDLRELLRLRKLPNAMVIVQPLVGSLCAQLHQLSHQELVEGYELPYPSLCRPDFSGGVVRGLDANFATRLDFFRTIPSLSLGSALSLSFRFKNFAAKQVPVLKFNEMHWRRMLPWISESTAEEIRRHVQQNLHQR